MADSGQPHADTFRALFAKLKPAQIVEDPAVINQCIFLASKNNLTQQKFMDEWEAYCVIQKNIKNPTLPLLEKFSHTLLTQTKTRLKQTPVKVRKTQKIQSPPKIALPSVISDEKMDLDTESPTTSPQKTIPTPKPESKPKLSAYQSRNNSGQSVVSFNEGLQSLEATKKEVQVDIKFPTNLTVPYKHMWNRPEDTISLLDERINKLGKIILQENQLGDPNVFHVPNQAELVAVGVICKTNSAFTDRNIYLQSSTHLTGDQERVRLDLIESESVEFFLGQVVVIQGVNLYGKRLVVRKVYSQASLPKQIFTTKQAPTGLKVVVANGPFTTSSNLDFEPLRDLVDRIGKLKPDALILVGPFADSRHPLIANQSQTKPFADIFNRQITFLTGDRLKNVKIILVPSMRDAHHSAVFPQPPYNPSEANFEHAHTNFICAPNPCTFRINGISFGVCSNDILKQLSQTGLSIKKNSIETFRPALMAKHVIEQQSYSPLFPIPPNKTEGQACCLKKMNHAQMPFTPDVLLFNSMLVPFVNKVNDVLCVNSQRLVLKDEIPGFYAVLDVHPLEPHSDGIVATRTKVDIVRI